MNRVQLAPGIFAIAPGFAFIERTRTLVTADTHFGYEEAIGSALPAWSTRDMRAMLLGAIESASATELVILGDIVHSARLSDGMAARVRSVLDEFRAICSVRLIAGNHEGRGRARHILGGTEETLERDGWMLAHGDVRIDAKRTMIGHIHPSLALDGGKTVPAFLASPSVIVVPALTPYSPGLSATSADCLRALAPFGVKSFHELHLTACTPERLYPFGRVSAMHAALSRPQAEEHLRFKRRVLRPDR